MISPENVLIGAGARLGSGVVLDASRGPVIIAKNAEIMAQAVLVGPVCIGEASRVKIGARIYEGTSIGPLCKIGGEVEELFRLGIALRWIPWLFGVPIVFPLMSRATPQSLEQFVNSANDEMLMPLMSSGATFAGYMLNALLWATVIVILTLPREPRSLWHRRRR
jgi:hypothetical protein